MSVQRSIEELQEALDGVDRIPVEYADRLCKILDDAPKGALKALVRNRVKFAWVVARTRLVRDHGMTYAEVDKLWKSKKT
jgi:3-hydroxyacyl-CoA dehydrogenase